MSESTITPVPSSTPAPVTVATPSATPTISLADITSSTGTLTTTTTSNLTTPTPVESNGTIDTQIANLPAEQRDQIMNQAASINLLDPSIDQSYGRDVQRASTTTADRILETVRSKDTGQAGALLQDMLGVIDRENLGSVSKIPLLGNLLNSANAIRRKYQKVSSQIDDITGQLEEQQSKMISDISMFEQLYAANAETYRNLKTTVLAGKKALADFRANQLPQLEAEAANNPDPMAGQTLKDFKDKLNRFEKHLDDLDRVSIVSLQSAPQIKIIQNADKTIADKINTTISTTIPVWKSQMVIALGLENQRKALELQQKADDVTNRMIAQNAKALHQGAVAAEKANQRSVIDIETLQSANNELIATLKDTMEIQRKGHADRQAAEVKMRQLESQLKSALIENAQQMR